MQTRITPNRDTFYAVYVMLIFLNLYSWYSCIKQCNGCFINVWPINISQNDSFLTKCTKCTKCKANTLALQFDCMFLSCHVRVSEWIHTDLRTKSFWVRVQLQLLKLQFDIFINFTEAFSVPCQISMIEHFVKIVNAFYLLTIVAKPSIVDVWQGSQYVCLVMDINFDNTVRAINFGNNYKELSRPS